jgi:uncharacterized damage-inducible protein DinB
VEAGWQQLNELLGSLSTEQLTGPRDAHGWSVREHLIHISAWEHWLLALVNRTAGTSASSAAHRPTGWGEPYIQS